MDSVVVQVRKDNDPLIQSICFCLKQTLLRLLTCDFFKRIQPHSPVSVPKQVPKNAGKKTLIIDLDETLVHSQFNYYAEADFTLKIRVKKSQYSIYVNIRPGCEDFLLKMSELFEIFIFTASLPEYANPVIDKIDPKGVCSLRLFRSNCSVVNGTFVKDLSRVGRDLKSVIIIDVESQISQNSKQSFQLQPNNAIHIKNYFDDPTDTELTDLIPFLILISQFDDVRPVEHFLKKFRKFEQISFTTKGEKKIYDRRENIVFDEVDPVNQTLDSSKDDTSLLRNEAKHKQSNIKLQTRFSIDEEEYAAEMQYREEQGLNSPNPQKKEDEI